MPAAQQKKKMSPQKLSIMIAILGGFLTITNTLIEKIIPDNPKLIAPQQTAKVIVVEKDHNQKPDNESRDSVKVIKSRVDRTIDGLAHTDIFIMVPLILVIMALGHLLIDFATGIIKKKD